MRPERPDIAAPELPGRPLARRRRAAEDGRADRSRTGARPLLRLRAAEQRPRAALRDRLGCPLSLRGADDARGPLAALPLHLGRATLGPALGLLGVSHPVADDSRFDIWHDYGCKGWPSLFLWNQGGALGWFHFGEGEYAATEAAIVEGLAAAGSGFTAPAPLAPIRATDASGALVAPPSEEVFPGGAADRPWRPLAGGGPLELDYEAGGAHASTNGTGALRVSVDGRAVREVRVAAPGLVDLAVHPRHERHTLRLDADEGIEIYSVSFSAGIP